MASLLLNMEDNMMFKKMAEGKQSRTYWETRYTLDSDGTGKVNFFRYKNGASFHDNAVHIAIEDLRDIKKLIEEIIPELDILIDTQQAVRD